MFIFEFLIRGKKNADNCMSGGCVCDFSSSKFEECGDDESVDATVACPLTVIGTLLGSC